MFYSIFTSIVLGVCIFESNDDTASYSLSTILKQNVHRAPREKEVCLTYLL